MVFEGELNKESGDNSDKIPDRLGELVAAVCSGVFVDVDFFFGL